MHVGWEEIASSQVLGTVGQAPRAGPYSEPEPDV